MTTFRPRGRRYATLAVALVVTLAAREGWPQDAPPRPLDPVVVTATRSAARAFDVPASVDIIDGSAIHDAQPMVNLSETLPRVPGVFAANRQNYAQDLQISSRGFGARAAFGVRGVRLYQDGIPATMPDGQGQTGSFSLFSAQRVEVLRGPFSTLYGNASGGVISVFTEDGSAVPTASFNGEGATTTPTPRARSSRAPRPTRATSSLPTRSTHKATAITRRRVATWSTPSCGSTSPTPRG